MLQLRLFWHWLGEIRGMLASVVREQTKRLRFLETMPFFGNDYFY